MCMRWFSLLHLFIVDMIFHKQASHPLSSKARFCDCSMTLFSIAHLSRVSLSMMVYSLYSTLSNVMGRKPLGVGGVLGLGKRVVIPFDQEEGWTF